MNLDAELLVMTPRAIGPNEEMLLGYIGGRDSKRARDRSRAMDSAFNAGETLSTKHAAVNARVDVGQVSLL